MANGKKKLTPEIKVGLFILFVILGLGYLSTQIASTGFGFKKFDHYDLYFDNVSGLLIRTPVEFNGIRVGYVEKIGISDGKTPRVKVRISVNEGLRIYEDSVVSLQSRGLLGEKIIMISGGGAAARIPPGGLIENTQGSAGFEEAVGNFSEVAQSIKEFIKGGNGKPSIQDIVSNTTDITEELREAIRGKRGDLEQIVGNIKEVSTAMKDFMKSNDPNKPSGLENLKATMEKLDRTVASLQEVVNRVERGEGTLGKLLTDDTTVNKVNDALDGVNEFVGQIKQLEISVGFRSEYMSDEEGAIAVTSFKFRPAYDKYFLLEFTDGPIGFSRRSKTITETETSPPGTRVTETVTKRGDGFTFTAVFARRFYDLTMKAGLFRSSGYVGAEYHLFNDHLSLVLDAFNFNRSENAQLRAYAQANFFKAFNIRAGVDDIIHSNNRRNYFAGLGFMLNDEDLKKLFSVAPLLGAGN